MDIRLAESNEEIAACFPVMASLRPDLIEEAFVDRVQRQRVSGFQVVCLSVEGLPVAVAGFWVRENLAWGRHLYVDDFVTVPTQRSQGHGATLLAWLNWFAAEAGCGEVHLDSGTHREDAHRFYHREGFTISSFHFRKEIPTK